jgi:DNA uptake protein ComE-like DNA-binding protein
MAKRVSKKSALAPEVQAWRDARDFFQALDELEEKRGIKKEYMMEKIRLALVSAY